MMDAVARPKTNGIRVASWASDQGRADERRDEPCDADAVESGSEGALEVQVEVAREGDEADDEQQGGRGDGNLVHQQHELEPVDADHQNESTEEAVGDGERAHVLRQADQPVQPADQGIAGAPDRDGEKCQRGQQ